MGHLVLLGDSTLDNLAYVRGGPAVIEQVRDHLPGGWTASLLAVDGARIDGVPRQLDRLPEDASHLALSIGGNDLLAESGVLEKPAGSVGAGLLLLAEVRDRFEAAYAGLLQRVMATGLPLVVCTVYEPRPPDAIQRRATATAVGLFDDVIVRSARRAGVPVLDLRAVCSGDADFANPIEPSSAGGDKIARHLVEIALRHDFGGRRAVVYPSPG
ncbi:SGNH/GDSL hydrolase family protein [Tundrisphaera sp. TA3]|uniref:SGNH/GDSL hydrolase family protein n=1 Tax=Tundrisphaera sp. TA3 TaxID=3435775 RepID=UPI003EBD742F